MNDENPYQPPETESNQIRRSKVFDNIASALFWLRIAVSPILVGLFSGAFLYFAVGGSVGAILFALLLSIGIVFGVVFAEWARQRHGTVNFVSKSENSTPDVDQWLGDHDRK